MVVVGTRITIRLLQGQFIIVCGKITDYKDSNVRVKLLAIHHSYIDWMIAHPSSDIWRWVKQSVADGHLASVSGNKM